MFAFACKNHHTCLGVFAKAQRGSFEFQQVIVVEGVGLTGSSHGQPGYRAGFGDVKVLVVHFV